MVKKILISLGLALFSLSSFAGTLSFEYKNHWYDVNWNAAVYHNVTTYKISPQGNYNVVTINFGDGSSQTFSLSSVDDVVLVP